MYAKGTDGCGILTELDIRIAKIDAPTEPNRSAGAHHGRQSLPELFKNAEAGFIRLEKGILMTKKIFAFLLIAALSSPNRLPAEDVLKDCYQATVDKRTFTYSGGKWLQMLRTAAQQSVAPALTPLGKAKKPTGTKCTGNMEPGLQQSPTDLSAATSYYFGKAGSYRFFRQMAEVACRNTPAYTHQFFEVGKVILYRDCRLQAPDATGALKPNPKKGYIYFWGLEEGASQCSASAYPVMYANLKAKRKTFTMDDLTAAETQGNIGQSDVAGQALANELGAELVAESERDVNLKFLNLMLIDIATAMNTKAKPIGPEVILGGYCPDHVPAAECQNPDTTIKGIHPLAWGGALGQMMLNETWGMGQGANSEFGKEFEAGEFEQWLGLKKDGKPVKLSGRATCDGAVPAADQSSVRDMLDSLGSSRK